MRPTFTTGEAPAKVSTTAICRNTRKESRMLLALMMLGEALGAVAALQQESLARGDPPKRFLQLARLACKDQRRKGGELPLDRLQCGRIWIVRHLHDGLGPPAFGRPPVVHEPAPNVSARSGVAPVRPNQARLISEDGRGWRERASRGERDPGGPHWLDMRRVAARVSGVAVFLLRISSLLCLRRRDDAQDVVGGPPALLFVRRARLDAAGGRATPSLSKAYFGQDTPGDAPGEGALRAKRERRSVSTRAESAPRSFLLHA